jgi:SAM-dependent methyltransferase
MKRLSWQVDIGTIPVGGGFLPLIPPHLVFAPVPSLARRIHAEEMMDDLSIVDERLTRALRDLRLVNRWLGGHRAAAMVLAPYLMAARRPVRALDLGTGGADFPIHLVRWADALGCEVHVVGLDANPVTVSFARQQVARRLPPRLRGRVQVVEGDALAPPFGPGTFDVVTAALFLHHFDDDEAVHVLHRMHTLARDGIVVNDLHRHPLAFYGLQLLSWLLPVSEMFAHDGPLSIRRGFRRDELRLLAERANLSHAAVRWHWAFRWTLSTL